MSRTKVIHVSVGINVGGMEKLLVEFARHADRNRFELSFISLTHKGEAGEEIEKLGWSVTALNISPGVRPEIVFRLAQLFRDGGPGIVQTHNTKPLLYSVPAAVLAGRGRIIHTLHGQRLEATPRRDLLFNLAAGWTDRIVSVSDDSARLVSQQGIPHNKLVTIHNGVDLSQYPASGPRSSGPVVFVGRLSPEKDIPTLLRAAAIAIGEEPSLRFHLAGDGPCLGELQTLTQQLGVDRQVAFLGQRKDVAAVLADASVFALSSLTEGISLAVLEAMACGLPVVATAVGGNPEVVVEGETGFLVPPQSPHELATAILKLYRQPEMGRQMGARGRQRVEARFDSRKMVAAYESLYVSGHVNRMAA